jgi:hypothetical protein
MLKKKYDFHEKEGNKKVNERILKPFEKNIFRDFFLLSITNGLGLTYFVFRKNTLKQKLIALTGELKTY